MTGEEFARNLNAALARAAAEQETAHAHAQTFAGALSDEIETAKRAGACQSCILNSLLEAVGREVIGHGVPPENTWITAAALLGMVEKSVWKAAVERAAALQVKKEPAP